MTPLSKSRCAAAELHFDVSPLGRYSSNYAHETRTHIKASKITRCNYPSSEHRSSRAEHHLHRSDVWGMGRGLFLVIPLCSLAGRQRVVCWLYKTLAGLVQLCLDIISPAVATSGDSFIRVKEINSIPSPVTAVCIRYQPALFLRPFDCRLLSFPNPSMIHESIQGALQGHYLTVTAGIVSATHPDVRG